MANISQKLLGRWFNNQKPDDADSNSDKGPSPDELAENQAAPDGSSPQTRLPNSPEEARVPNTSPPQAPLFPEAGHIWDDYTDPLYVKPSEENLLRECRSIIQNLEKTHTRELEAEKRARLMEEAKARYAARRAALDENDNTGAAGDTDGDSTSAPASTEDPAVETEPDRDAQIHVFLSSDQMAAWVYTFPPSGGGSHISSALLQDTLKENDVRFGLLQENIRKILEQEPYRQPVLIARGIPSKNGINGTVTDHYKREITHEFVADSKGNINFKQLNNIQQVNAGDIICDITLPVSGETGKTVTGSSVICRIPGRPAPIPQGTGTSLSEDRKLLLARLDGHLQFKNNVFFIDPVLKIPGDVDGTTGNLDYRGDISISGDVRNGFTVKASGSIFIKGSVEGAFLEAGQDIRITSGVTGNGRATLTAGGSVQCKYLEHCTVTALGDVQSESMVLCQVQCNQNVIVSSGIGAIIGGKIIAATSIRAKSIGSKSRHITSLVIGTPFKAVEERRRAEQEMKQIEHNLSELKKNITYLQSGRNPGKIHMLKQLQEAQSLILNRQKAVAELLTTLEENVCDLKSCRIICSRLFPVTDLQIGAATLRVFDQYSNCSIYYSDDKDIVIGTQ